MYRNYPGGMRKLLQSRHDAYSAMPMPVLIERLSFSQGFLRTNGLFFPLFVMPEISQRVENTDKGFSGDFGQALIV